MEEEGIEFVRELFHKKHFANPSPPKKK